MLTTSQVVLTLLIDGNTFFYNTSTESVLASMDSIDALSTNIGTGSVGGVTFGFDTSFGNVSAVSGTTLVTGNAAGGIAGLNSAMAINSGTVVFSGGDISTVADNCERDLDCWNLDAGLTQQGDSVAFTNTGVGGDIWIFTQKGDDDLLINIDNNPVQPSLAART